MFLEPDRVAPTGVWQREEVREVVAVRVDSFGHGGFALVAEVELLRVLADEERQSQVFELFADLRMPERSAFRTWGEVATFDVGAWVTEAHRDECETPRVVELLWSDIEPTTKADATGIGPGFVIDMR